VFEEAFTLGIRAGRGAARALGRSPVA